jgi:hypothetical protein
MDKPGTLTPSADVGPARWIAAGVPHRIAAPVPAGFEAYARILHPALRWDDDVEVEVPWAEVAAATHTPLHPGVTWETVAGRWHPHGHPGVWDEEPIEGQPSPRQAARLVTLLAAHTTDQDHCRYAVWDGYGALTLPRDGVPRFDLPGLDLPGLDLPRRSMLLLTGPLAAAGTSLESAPFDRRANLWWPDDRAWFVGTDVEATSTYVGGSRACVDALLGDDVLEALEV